MGSEEEEEDDAGDAGDAANVTRIGNRVFFYTDVSVASVQVLYQRLQAATQHALTCSTSQVHLHLHSNGGDAHAGLAAYYHISRNAVDVITHVDGYVASAATFLLLAGKTRVIARYGFVLIHQVSAGFFGKYRELVDEMGNTNDLMGACRSLYLTNTSMSAERLEELLTSERACDAAACVRDGIVSAIV